jgi:hypothetical protein
VAKELVPKVVVSSPDGDRHHDHPLVKDRVTVGRAVPGFSPDIPLGPDPQMWIGRVHCSFERVDGMWQVVNNVAVGGTLVERQGKRDLVDGQHPLKDQDEVLILGYMVNDEPFWWRLRLRDPFATADRPPLPGTSSPPYLEYDFATATLIVVQGDRRTEIRSLGRNRQKLVRYMVSCNARNGGTPVTCTHEELIVAVWGEPETWRYPKARTPENLRDLVFELRKQLVAEVPELRDQVGPHGELIETITGIGYLLRTQP